jgi:hypothetical protein
VGGACFSGRSRPPDAVVRRLDHRAYRQRLRDVYCLAETPLVAIPMILLLIALFYHTALGLRDRGLRPFRDQVRGGDRGASWLLRARDRGCRGHPAHCAQRLRGTIRELRKPCNEAGAAHSAVMDRKDAWPFG